MKKFNKFIYCLYKNKHLIKDFNAKPVYFGMCFKLGRLKYYNVMFSRDMVMLNKVNHYPNFHFIYDDVDMRQIDYLCEIISLSLIKKN